MNTKFFFSAIALFAITSAANALPIGQHVKLSQVKEEVATSAVIKGAQVSGVNEEVATSAVIKGVEYKSGMEVAGGRIDMDTEFKSGMEVARKFGWPRVSDTEDPTVFGAKVPAVSDTEKKAEFAIVDYLRH